jgi:hypothetical protein
MQNEWSLTELRSDNSIMGNPASTSTVNRDLSDLDLFIPSTSHAGNYNYWLANYYNIRNINLVLNSLGVDYENKPDTSLTYNKPIANVSEAVQKSLSAEASFLRAYHYFNLVRLYGGVFLVHEPISPKEATELNRVSVEEVYKLVIADLKNAEANGFGGKFNQINPANLGRANKWSARALLAKVYLTLNRKAEARTLLQNVIVNSGYSLQTSYANVFSVNNEMNSEILFAVRYKSGGLGLGSPFGNSFAPLNSGTAVVNGDGQGNNTPAVATTVTAVTGIDLIYLTGDSRRAVNIGVFGTGTNRRLYPAKHIAQQSIVRDGEVDWPILRFSDVLLMYGEAAGNADANSLTYLNQVRTRAGLPAALAASVSTDIQFSDSLALERRRELAFENQRWFDILRFNTTLPTVKNSVQTIKDHYNNIIAHYNRYPLPRLSIAELQANVTQEKMLLPIPQREIDTNTKVVIAQNPGY